MAGGGGGGGGGMSGGQEEEEKEREREIEKERRGGSWYRGWRWRWQSQCPIARTGSRQVAANDPRQLLFTLHRASRRAKRAGGRMTRGKKREKERIVYRNAVEGRRTEEAQKGRKRDEERVLQFLVAIYAKVLGAKSLSFLAHANSRESFVSRVTSIFFFVYLFSCIWEIYAKELLCTKKFSLFSEHIDLRNSDDPRRFIAYLSALARNRTPHV